MNLGNHNYMVLATEGYQSSGSSDITVSEGPGGAPAAAQCGKVGGVAICCDISADPNGDGLGEQNGGEVCMVTEKTVGWHPENPADVIAAVNVGGSGSAFQVGNIWYEPNTFVKGGTANVITDAVSGGNDMFKSEAYGNLTIEIPVTNGNYSVELGFAELYHTSAGKRYFDVSIEGKNVLSNVDLYEKVGAKVAWKPAPYEVNVTDGKLNIVLTTIEDNATLSTLLVRKSTGASSSSSSSTRPSSSSSVAVSSSSANSSVASSSSSSTVPAPAAGSLSGLFLLMMGTLVFVTRRVTVKA